MSGSEISDKLQGVDSLWLRIVEAVEANAARWMLRCANYWELYFLSQRLTKAQQEHNGESLVKGWQLLLQM